MKKVYVTFLVVVMTTAVSSSAQLLYNNGALITIQNGAEVHVQGGIQNQDFAANDGIINLNGQLWAKTTSGNFDNLAGAETNIGGTGVLYVEKNYTNNATVAAAAGSKVVFNAGTGTSQTYSDANPNANPLYNVELQTDDLNLLSNLRIQPLGTLDFAQTHPIFGFTNNIINTGNYYVVMNTSGMNMAQFNGIHNTGGDAKILNKYVNGNVLWQVRTGTATTYPFPVGAKTGSKAAVQGAQYMELDGNFSLDGATFLEAYFEAVQPMTTPTGCLDKPLTHYTGIYHWRALTNAVPPATTASATPLTGTVGAYGMRMRPYSDEAAALDNTDIGAAVRHGAGALDFATDVIRFDDDIPANGVDVYDPCFNFGNKHNIYVTGLTSFSKGSGFGTTDPSVPFPIETLDFRATPLVSTIMLDWTTGREINTSYFDLERSLDGRSFVPIKTGIPARGFTTSETKYNFEDVKVQFNTTYYYRLRVVDNDGRTYYSQIRQAILTDKPDLEARFYPNPTSGDLTLEVVMPETGKVQVRLYDATGRLVMDGSHELPAGRNVIDFGDAVKGLASGSYMSQIIAGGKSFNQKLVKN